MGDKDMHLIAIDVRDASAQVDPRTNSRFNSGNISVVTGLIGYLFDSGALGNDAHLTVITPYAEQRSLYVKSFITFTSDKDVRWNGHGKGGSDNYGLHARA
ncbi:hypothetical protein Plec18170_003217 [Paecilomyces lecythidis]